MLPFKRILCPIDFSPASYEALKVAVEMAGKFEAALEVIHVIPPVPVHSPYPDPPLAVSFDVPLYQQELARHSEKALENLVGQAVPREIPTMIRVLTGEAAQEIVDFAAKESSSLIIIATHGLTGWRHFVIGSVTEKVIRLAPCPVLAIRGENQEK